MVKVYFPSLLNARAPMDPMSPDAGIPKNPATIAAPDEVAPTAPQIQLVAKHVLATILLAQQKFTAALPVVQTLSVIIYELATVGTCEIRSAPTVANLLTGVGAISNTGAAEGEKNGIKIKTIHKFFYSLTLSS